MDRLTVPLSNSAFPYKLDAEYVDGKNWKLINVFSYIDRDNGEILVPAGFITDFASIPKIFWSTFGAPSNYAPSATIHDYICRNKIFDRNKCDKIFYRAMIDSGVNYITAIAFYIAVSLYSNFIEDKGN